MIHELSHLNEKQVLNEIDQRFITQSSDTQNKETMIALSKIQLGDILSGKLILENDQTMLRLESGLKLLAHLPNSILSDQVLDFLVVGKGRQHLELEQVQLNQSDAKNQVLQEAIIKEMQLPDTAEMKNVVGQWMDQKLPLIKNQMIQLYHLAKNYDMPTETLTLLKAQQIPLSEHEMKLMNQFKSEGMQLIDEMVESTFKNIGPEEAIRLNMSLGEKFTLDTFKQILENFQGRDSSTGILQQNEKLSILTQEQTQNSQVENDLIKQLSTMTASESNETGDISKMIENLLQSVPKENLKDLANHLIHKYLMINHEDVLEKPEEEMLKLGEEAKRLKAVIKDFDKVIVQDETKTSLQTLDQMANVLEKYNMQGQYYCFPLQIKDQQTSGELYFFKPKKQKKSDKNEQGMYIVLALEMPSLKHIEVHLVEKKEQLELKIKVANETILKQMKANDGKLRGLIDETMMPIGEIKIELTKEPIQKKLSKSRETLGRMDFRI